MAEAVEHMTSYMSSQTLMQINEQKYQLIRDGIPVTRIKPTDLNVAISEINQ